MRTLPRLPVFAWILAALLCGSLATGPADAASEPAAVELAEAALEALGGAEAWNGTRHISFSFAGFRSHVWDKYTGRHRLQGKTRDGDSYVVLHNVNDRQGKVWFNGELLTGDDAATWLERAYGAWINDIYWLVMPYKLLDPGVTLTLDGSEEIDGRAHDKVKLTFDSVGLTPGDTYWAFLDRETKLMSRWAYVLESYEEGQEATAWDWTGWQRHGQILLAPGRSQVGGDRQLPMGDIAVHDQLPETVYTSPEADALP